MSEPVDSVVSRIVGEKYSDLSFMPRDLRTFYENNSVLFNCLVSDTINLMYDTDLVEQPETIEEVRDPETDIPYVITATKYDDFISTLKQYVTDECIEKKISIVY